MGEELPMMRLSSTMTEFASQLKKIRTDKGFTQTKLSEILNISPRVYNRWERGDATPHFDTIVQIAEVLQVSLDELAGRNKLVNEFNISNYKLNSLCQNLNKLSDTDQQALIILMDSLLKRQLMTTVMAG